uniref:ribosome silencing factor n=1 Tax=Pararhizobium sp. IMCC3301 TaxID=3067904 RepID=UPI002741E936|nr:ribosome silencing factor [Pararhizobium sp. IMCC3301]
MPLQAPSSDTAPKKRGSVPSAPSLSEAAAESGITSEDALKIVLASLDDSKAEETLPIDITGKSPLFDHIVVASGRSHRHVNAIADHLLRDLKTAGLGRASVEGLPACDWVLVDTGDVVVHIFRPEVREFYNIEKIWRAQDDDMKPATVPANA